MKLTSLLRGKQFGELAKLSGIITYKISPHEQRAFAGFLSHGFPNLMRRIRQKFLIVVPPFVVGYLVYSETEKIHDQSMRKNPDDYKDDK